ncbi:formate dehydrogenase accessory sulfurtransferase FdhD, partial [Mycobacterium tuberculosis]|uniref:formate dehydrogenase accessory sulfurtransferase FdhD n=1 Tax=Mycobacterium tuberculosis TaxID=1773 RepID=UPI003C6E1538
MVERNQRIGLRVVGRSIADRRRICHHQKVFCPPFLQTALAVEEPLEIRVNGTPVTVTMRTPGSDFELVQGFLLAEGVVA